MTHHNGVAIVDINAADARALIQRNHIGRLAFSLHDRVDIEPISYASEGEWIFMRTSVGRKATILRHHPWVAFQVDEIHDRFNWESTVVHGRVQNLPEDGSAAERELRARAVAALRALDPAAIGPNDTFPHRDQLLGLHMDEVTGRRAVLESSEPPSSEM